LSGHAIHESAVNGLILAIGFWFAVIELDARRFISEVQYELPFRENAATKAEHIRPIATSSLHHFSSYQLAKKW
jgi:hypothetical protein